MHQDERPIRSRLTAPKAAAIAGIVFSVLLMISFVLLLRTIPTTLTADDSWLATREKPILLAFNLVPFAGIAFLWFMGVVRDRFGDREDQFIATVFLGSGLLFLGMLFIFAATTGSIILLYKTDPNHLQSLNYYNFGRTFAHEVLNIYAVKMAAVFMLSTSTLFIRTKVIPSWMAMLGYALALVMLLKIEHSNRITWIILSFPLWVLLISIYILIDNYRRKSVQVSS